ncbi:MAG: hypothetical protein H7X93_01590 [Sphingomonadaceae bacterium]|nr:hypothetical protein [Sphingomonadaceae bacterium]
MPVIPGTTGDDDLFDTTGDDTVNALSGNDTIHVSAGSDVINGGADSDTMVIDWSGLAAFGPVTTSVPTANGTLGGFDGIISRNANHSVSFNSIEHIDITSCIGDFDDSITTATGDDRVIADDGDDTINVSRGTDTADGGAGTDRLTADFSDDGAGVAIDLNQVTNSGGFGIFQSFEYFGTITGSAFDDSFISKVGLGLQVFNLGGGSDLAKVVDGTATINGGLGDDTLVADWSDDATGAAVTGPTPNVDVDGGFNGSFSNGLSGGNRNSVAYDSIEHFNITTHVNGAFNDAITTATGDDRVITGAGNDSVAVGSGTDTANGGSGTDRLSADFSDEGTGVTLDWDQAAVHTGAFGSFSNFEYFGTVTGTGFDDRFVSVAGFGGFTQLFNLGGGDDSVRIVDGSATVNGDLGTDTLVFDFSLDSNPGAITTIAVPQVNPTLGGFNGSYFLAGPGSDDGQVNYNSIEHIDIATCIGAFNDSIRAPGGDDRIAVFAGDDTVNGQAGLDTLVIDYGASATGALVTLTGPAANGTLGGFDGKYSVSASHEVGYTSIERFEIVGGAFDDAITTATGNDVLDGGAGKDVLSAGGGKDTLTGGEGKDELKGGGGKDRFDIFLAQPAHADKIKDFAPGDDKIGLDSITFSLPEGALNPARFVTGTAAGDANDRIIYDPTTGKLFFDPDGTGAQAQGLIATLSGAPALTAGDIVVI